MVSLSAAIAGELLVVLNEKMLVIVWRDGLSETCYQFTNEVTTNGSEDCHGNHILAHTFNKNKDVLAAITEDKKLLVWKWGKLGDKQLLATINLPKRPTSLTFCSTSNIVLVADKYGDVYRCDPSNTEQGPQLLLGHLSMVLDVAVSTNDKYLISADRDEKIRVSSYPNAYSVHSYCLGHTRLVSKVVVLSDDHLLSCSADSTMKLWAFKTGQELNSINLLDVASDGQDMYLVKQILYDDKEDVFLIAERSKTSLYFKYNGEMITFNQTFSLHSLPFCMFLDENNAASVLVESTDEPVFKYFSTKDPPVMDYATILKENFYNFGNVPCASFYTSLVKPSSLKRPALITPEATINLQSAMKKKQKLGNIDNGEGLIEE